MGEERSISLENPGNTGYIHNSAEIVQLWASLVAQAVKRLPVMRETQVRFLGWEDTLEKEMATHSSTLAWKIPWTEEPDRLQFMGSQRVGRDWATSLSLSLCHIPYVSHSKGVKIYLQHKLLHADVYSRFLHNCQNLETTTRSFSGWIEKWTVINSGTGTLWRDQGRKKSKWKNESYSN